MMRQDHTSPDMSPATRPNCGTLRDGRSVLCADLMDVLSVVGYVAGHTPELWHASRRTKRALCRPHGRAVRSRIDYTSFLDSFCFGVPSHIFSAKCVWP